LNTINIWNALVDLYVRSTTSEVEQLKEIFNTIITATFGYKVDNNEILINRMKGLNSPYDLVDFYLQKDNANSFVMYIHPRVSNVSQNTAKQKLFDALRYFRLDVGCIISDRIYIYDYSGFVENSCITVSFLKDNWGGAKFVELFCRSNYSTVTVLDWISKYKNAQVNIVDSLKSDINKAKIKDLLINSINTELVLELLTQHFSGRVTHKEWIEIISRFDIQVSKKTIASTQLGQNEVSETKKMVTKPRLLTRNDVVNLVYSNNIKVEPLLLYATENKSIGRYCLSLEKYVLKDKFTILLNDKDISKIHVLNINGRDINKIMFERSNKGNIRLNLTSRGGKFEDMYTKLSFARFVTATISY
jgi:hypothetical protein